MIFSKEFTPLEKIQLLQRSILVNSYVYYELNNNLLSDYQYDTNAKQLADLKKQYPDDFNRSVYYQYFREFCSENDNEHYTSGFDLLQQVEEKDPDLYQRVWIDSMLALKMKSENLV